MVKKADLNRLTAILPRLEYINILSCSKLSHYDLRKFGELKFASVSQEMYTESELEGFRRSGIRLHVEETLLI